MARARILRSLIPLAAVSILAASPAAAGPRSFDVDSVSEVRVSSYGLFLAGQAALDQGRYEEAADFFSRAAQQDPQDGQIKTQAFWAALMGGDLGRAAQLAPGPSDGTPDDQRLGPLTRGVEAIAENHGGQAVTALSGEPMGPPYAAAAQLLLPWAAAEAGDWKTALAAPATGGDHLAEQIALLDQALLFENHRQNDDADQTFKQLISVSGGADLFVIAYGEFLQRHDRTADAITLFQQSLKTNPSDTAVPDALAHAQAHQAPAPAPTLAQGAGRALLAPAELLLGEKQPRLGLVYLRMVLRLDPTRDEAWLLVGDTLAASDQTDQARGAYAQVKPASPYFVAAQARLISTYDQPGDEAMALKLAQQATAAAPNDTEAQLLLADALRINGKPAELAKVMDALIAQAGGNAAWSLYYMRGVALDQAGDWPGAERDLKQALSTSPDQPEVLNYLGYSWIDRGLNMKTAKAMIERAVAAKPDSGAMVDSLGWADYHLGQYTEAVQQLERATQLEPADPDINDHLGDAYWKAGRKLEARFQWEQVLTLRPSDKLKARVEEKLKTGLDTAPAAVAER